MVRRFIGRRTILVPPFIALLLFRLRRAFDLNENDVDPDFIDLSQIDKEIAFPEAKTSSARHYDALHFSFRISEHYVAYFPEAFAVAKIDRLFPF